MGYKQYLDSVFKAMKTNNTHNPAVDIKGNKDGDDDIRDEVITYPLKQTFTYSIKRYYRFLTVHDSLASYLKTWTLHYKSKTDKILP
jgi:hypothetical protein